MKSLLEPASSSSGPCLCLRKGAGGVQAPSLSCKREGTGRLPFLPCPWTWDGACLLAWLSLLPLFLLSFCIEKNTKANKDWEISAKSKMNQSSSFQIISFICSASLSSLHVHLWLFFLSPCVSFLIFSRNRDVHPRLNEPDFHITVSHGEDQIFTDEHPTHALSSIPSANSSPVVCAESCKC